MVRQFLAALLLVCFGILVPTAASPMRVCFLEEKLLEPGFTSFGETASHKLKCCPDCGSPENGDGCCMDVRKLPDAPDPSGTVVVLPALLLCELPVAVVLPSCPLTEAAECYVPSRPIRGPDEPGARRALLAIWNI